MVSMSQLASKSVQVIIIMLSKSVYQEFMIDKRGPKDISHEEQYFIMFVCLLLNRRKKRFGDVYFQVVNSHERTSRFSFTSNTDNAAITRTFSEYYV